MRQVIVLVEATLDASPISSIGGRAVPDVGGYVASGIIDDCVDVAGRTLTFACADLAGASPSVVRFVHPSGEWDDYAGPGVGWLSDPERTPAEKGLPVTEVLGEAGIASIVGDTVELDADPPALAPGDVVYLVGEGEHAGAPGWLYAKVLVDRDGNRAVHHYRAVDVASDDRIAATASASSTHRFPAPPPGSTLEVTARVVYRRQADAVASVYGWAREDTEIGRATASLTP
jgi:hypothetical protein